jgi:ABC-type nitrate/sulfonate/bicarbonate transport system permease component
VAALAVYFFVFISTTVGLGAAPRAAHDVASVLGASSFRRVFSVQLPASWPSIADGLKLAAPAAMAGAVFGEWYGAERGLGVLLITAMQSGRADRLWAASLLAAVCGLLAYGLLAMARALLARRYGATIAEASNEDHLVTNRLREIALEAVAIATLVVVLVTIWWAWIELADIAGIVVPRPSAVWSDLWSSPGDYLDASRATLWNAAIALPIGGGVGLLLALLASRYRILSGMTVPIAVMLSATPLVALFPLFARVFGYQPNTVRILASVIVFYPMFVYTRSGLMAASQSSIDVVDSLGGTPGSRFRLVVLPSAIPHIASGVRIAAGSAVIAAVVGEFLIGRSGLGVEFSYAYSLLRLPRAFGAAVVIVVVSLIVFAVAGKFERSVHARWT